MKLRSFFYILASLVATLLLIAGVGGFWLVSHNPLALLQGSQQANPRAAMFVSRQAVVMASLLVNPDRLESFGRAAVAPEARRQATAELAQLRQSLLGQTGLNYEQDIQPWLAEEMTVAVTSLDLDRDGSNGQQPGYLLVLTSKNAAQAREFLQLFWQKQAIAGVDLVFEQYKGTKVIYGAKKTPLEGQAKAANPAPEPAPGLATALVGNQYILFANHPKVVREAINNVQASDLALANAPDYQKALDNLTTGRIGLVYLNLPQLAALTGSEAAGSQEAPSPFENLALGLGLTQAGLIADAVLLPAPGQSFPPTSPVLTRPVAALQYLPISLPLAASGTNLEQGWQGVAKTIAAYAPLNRLVNQPLTVLQTQWQLQLPEDVFSWVGGEYALGMVPLQESAAKPQLDWVFVAEAQQESAQQGIAHLDDLARQQGLSVGPLKLGEQTVTAWTRLATEAKKATRQKQSTLSLTAQVVGVHGPIDRYEVFATSAEALDKALRGGQASLAKAADFNQAIAPLAKPNNGYLYIDWPSTQAILKQQVALLRLLPLSSNALTQHIKSLTITSYGSQEGVQRGGAFIRLLESDR